MKCHELNYQIIGHDLQLVEIELDPNETVIAEAGAMSYMEQGIQFETKLGDGSNPDQGIFGKLFSAGKRAIIGESLFMTHFTNDSNQISHVGFSAPYPGQIIAVNMAEIGEQLFCQKESFLCAALGTRLSIAFTKRLGAGFFGGEGFILEKLEGDGLAFLHAGGTIIKKQLNNETLRVDTGCLVGFAGDIDYSIELAGGLKSMLFGGEGIFLTTLSGTGTVYLQSMPFAKLANRIFEHLPDPENHD